MAFTRLTYRRFSLYIFLLICLGAMGVPASANTVICGRIPPDSVYGQRLHLLIIPKSHDFNAYDKQQELAFIDLDSSGVFCFTDVRLDTANQFYQLHLSTEEDFASYIYDPLNQYKGHNFIKFIAQAGDSIYVASNDSTQFATLFSTNPIAHAWQQVDALKRKWLFEDAAHQLTLRGRLQAYSQELHQLAFNKSSIAQWPAVVEMNYVLKIDSNFTFTPEQEVFISNFNAEFFGIHPPSWTDKISLSAVTIGVLILIILILLWRIRQLQVVHTKEGMETTDKANVLSRQEERVYALLQQNKTNKQIADELFISVSTVKTHLSNIYKKLNIKGRKSIST